MAYKPLSQTVANGKTAEVSSSDAVFDAIALKQDALQSGVNIKTINGSSLLGPGDVTAASTTLDNLAVTTAVNQDLNLNAGKALTGQFGSVISTGINAVTPATIGTTTINTSASISSVLQIGDVIQLEGLTDRLATVVTKASATQITVNQALGVGGSNLSRQIQIVKPIVRFKNASGVDFFSIYNSENRSILFPNEQGSRRLFIGSLPTVTTVDTLVVGNNSSGGGISIGHGINGNASGGIMVGHDMNGISNSVTIKSNGTFTPPYEGIAIGSGTVNPGNYYFHIGMQSNVTVNGTTIGNQITNTTASGNIVIGQNISGGGVTSPSTVGSNVALGMSPGTTYDTFAIGKRFYFFGGVGAGNIGEMSYRNFYMGSFSGNQPLPTILSQSFYTNQSAANAQVNFYPVRGAGIAPSGTIRFLTAPKSSISSTTANSYVAGLQIDGAQGDVQLAVGSLSMHKVGAGLKIATGTNATAGVAIVADGTSEITVTTNKVDTSSIILVTNQTSTAAMSVTTKASGSFKIAHVNNVTGDQSVAWFIINTLEDESIAFFNAAGITDATQKSAVDRLVKDLKSADMWNRMLAIYPMVGGTATTHKFNLKDPRDLDVAYRLTFNGTWTHSSTGAKGNGIDANANTYFIPDATSANSLGWGYNGYYGANVTRNGQHSSLSYYSRTTGSAPTNASAEIGADTAILLALRTNNTTNYQLVATTTGSQGHSTVTAGSGYYILNRNQLEAGSGGFDSLREVMYWNGAAFSSRSATNMTNPPSTPIYLNSYGATGGRYSARECAFAHIGFGLFSELEMIELNRIVVAYQTALGRNV